MAKLGHGSIIVVNWRQHPVLCVLMILKNFLGKSRESYEDQKDQKESDSTCRKAVWSLGLVPFSLQPT